MAKPKSPNGIRAEVTELKERIRTAVSAIDQAKDDRAESNAVIAEHFAALETKGIHRKALAWAMIYASWDSDARAGFDVAYQIVREAIGVPLEDQLFDANGMPNLKIPSVAKAAELHEKNSAVKGDDEEDPADGDGDAPESDGDAESMPDAADKPTIGDPPNEEKPAEAIVH